MFILVLRTTTDILKLTVRFTLKIHLTIIDLTDQEGDGCVNLDIKVIVVELRIVKHQFEGPFDKQVHSVDF